MTAARDPAPGPAVPVPPVPGTAVVIGAGLIGTSVALALSEAWLGLVLAFYTDWPTSFWITALSSGAYLVAVLCGNLPVKPRAATASAPSG